MSRKIQIMIIDDDKDDLAMLEDAIKEFDPSYICIKVGTGVKALELLSDQTRTLPDLIFLDIKMPKMSGKTVLTKLKSYNFLRNIPVVILTTSTDVDESVELKNLGADHFCSKPADPRELYYVVSLSLEEHLFPLS